MNSSSFHTSGIMLTSSLKMANASYLFLTSVLSLLMHISKMTRCFDKNCSITLEKMNKKKIKKVIDIDFW